MTQEKTINRKSHYHSTVGRRDFMKMLGVGTGAVAMAGMGENAFASFKDVDEMIASPFSERNLPWWVKEVDEPTLEIDWDNYKVFPGFSNVLFKEGAWGNDPGWKNALKSNIEFVKKGVQENRIGYSLKDRALADANCWGWAPQTGVSPAWTGPELRKFEGWEHPTTFYEPQDYGVPRHEATPEENSRMLRVAGRILGAADMGFVKLDERTKKFLYGSEIAFEDVEKGYVRSDGVKVLPANKDLYVICSLIPQSLWMAQYTDRMSWAAANTAAYARADIFSNRIKVFLRGLGWQHYGGGSSAIGRNVPFGIMAGLGEGSRAGIMCSPQYGTNVRETMLTITDLPLAVTKPIDAGIVDFCKVCMKCADMCPSGAIPKTKEPWFTTEDLPWQGMGYKGWYQDAKKCYSYMLGAGDPDCSRCQAACPFTKFDAAVMHDLIKIAIAKAPMLNSAIHAMDDIFGYGAQPPADRDPWKVNPMDIPLYGLDSSRS